nr:3-deoxy-manno-octulosonate cytidylyltransferase [uncultured Rhodopila sp.]
MNPIVVIPARMASTRLPGKPLADINGKPMIVHMIERGRQADIGPVAVACAEAVIADVVRAAGGRAVLTDPALPSGSDRVHAALAELDPDGRHDVVVNLQGDFPTLDPAGLRLVITPLDDPKVDIGTLVVPIRDDAEAATASFVKAACAFEGGRTIAPALYFSRQAIPWGPGPRWHHVGIYAYRRAVLDRYVSLPPSPLERRESLEQLRALEDGMRIACVRMQHGPFGVDTPEDLERARAVLACAPLACAPLACAPLARA